MKRLAALLCLAALPAAAQTTPRQDPQAVQEAARQAALALAPTAAAITISPADAAKFMPACTAPLSVSLSGNAPYQEAAVHCPSPAWVLYLTVTIAAQQMVEVAARPITAGQTLGPDDIRLAQEPVSLFAGRQVFFGPQALVGAQATMSLPPGGLLTATAVMQPVAVTAGQMVTVQVINGGVQLSVNAVAAQTGRVGETVLMTNPASGRRFSALLTASGPVVNLAGG